MNTHTCPNAKTHSLSSLEMQSSSHMRAGCCHGDDHRQRAHTKTKTCERKQWVKC